VYSGWGEKKISKMETIRGGDSGGEGGGGAQSAFRHKGNLERQNRESRLTSDFQGSYTENGPGDGSWGHMCCTVRGGL